MLRRTLTFLVSCWLVAAVQAATPASPRLLQEAVEDWLGERDHWAFTQRAIEYEDDGRYERLERFDPSKPGDARWELLAINGKPPTPEQFRKWADKKFKRHPRRIDAEIADFFDFRAARIIAETPQLARFEVPLRHDKSWLFPVDKVGVRVTVNKQTKALEHLSAHVREPFRVLLGLARITGGQADLDFLHYATDDPSPAGARPSGVAQVSVFRMGERIDFTWSDFRRVKPARTTAQNEHGTHPLGTISP